MSTRPLTQTERKCITQDIYAQLRNTLRTIEVFNLQDVLDETYGCLTSLVGKEAFRGGVESSYDNQYFVPGETLFWRSISGCTTNTDLTEMLDAAEELVQIKNTTMTHPPQTLKHAQERFEIIIQWLDRCGETGLITSEEYAQAFTMFDDLIRKPFLKSQHD